ncbi:hypothetical protein IJD15_02445 [bacterium]|nr:hypothetical protein [bacterium]
MKINPVNSINNCSHFKALNVQQKNNTVTIPDSADKKDLTIIALGALGVAAIAVHAVKSKKPQNIHELKVKTKKVTTNINKKIYAPKRGAEARRRYLFEQNQRKLESLHQRLFNGEFDGKSPEAMEKIIRNEINLAHATGRLKKG